LALQPRAGHVHALQALQALLQRLQDGSFVRGEIGIE
jgi:hypothetical protein